MKCNCRSHNGFFTVRGYAEHAQRENDRAYLASMAPKRYLDKLGSVSALIEIEIDGEYDPRHTEFN